MFAIGVLQQADSNSIPWYWYALLVLIVLALIVWWLFRRVNQMERNALSGPAEVPQTERREVDRQDDLTRIEGIGPKVAKVLQEAGINNFEALSQAKPDEIKASLNNAGLQMMSPEGWIEQAQLAAQGDWDGLQKLQDQLKGGRRK